MASSWLLEPVAGQAAAGRSLVPAAFRNGWLASAVLQGGATKVPPPNLVLHLPRCPSTPVGVASGAGPSHGDGWPAPGHPIPTRRPAGHPRVDRGSSNTVEAGGPRRGGQAGNRPRLARHHILAFQARTPKLLNRLQWRASTTGGRLGRTALSLQQERHTPPGVDSRTRARASAWYVSTSALAAGSGQEVPGRLAGRSQRQPEIQ
jgi:hypothetical protein